MAENSGEFRTMGPRPLVILLIHESSILNKTSHFEMFRMTSHFKARLLNMV